MEANIPKTGQGSMTTSERQRVRSEKASDLLFSVTIGGKALASYGLSSFTMPTPLPFLVISSKSLHSIQLQVYQRPQALGDDFPFFKTDSLTFPLTPKVDWTGPSCLLEGTRESAVIKVATILRDVGNGPVSLQQEI